MACNRKGFKSPADVSKHYDMVINMSVQYWIMHLRQGICPYYSTEPAKFILNYRRDVQTKTKTAQVGLKHQSCS